MPDGGKAQAIRKVAVIGICGIFCALFAWSTRIDPDKLAQIARSLGIVGVTFISAALCFTQVLSFLSTTPIMLVAIRLYGYFNATILLYCVTLISSIINYWTGRTFGRTIVRRIVGDDVMRRIDAFSALDQSRLLLVGRLFGYFFVDVLSYVFGLAKIPFRKYFLYTALLTIIPTAVEYAIFRNVKFDSVASSLIYYGYLLATAILFIGLARTIYSKQRP